MCRITDERQIVKDKPQSLFDVHFGGKNRHQCKSLYINAHNHEYYKN